jgi:CubicO group peptidase (beta-lactamase class C family)
VDGPEVVRKALGNYQVSTTYFNADFEEVNSAGNPGRYGAVVTVRFASGVTLNRYYTLFKYPGTLKDQQWWQWAVKSKTPVNLELPPALGIDPAVASDYENAISIFVRFGFFEDLKKRAYAARLMAGLYDKSTGARQRGNKGKGDAASPDQPAAAGERELMELDRQWWVTLKEKRFPASVSLIAQGFAGPALMPNAVSTMVQVGADPMSAGMSPAVTDSLERVLNEWAANSDEAFSVLVARNGKVFYEKAFGQRDGVALTMNDKCHIASVNKTFTGILLTMCIEKGYISMDDKLSRFFPSLAAYDGNTPITIRHLTNHTSGLPDLSLDEVNDLEEIIKPFLPYVKPGEKYDYCQTGYSLLGKVMERITGKTFSTLLQEWLLTPMALTHTEVTGAASDAWSTPEDLAKIAQLILNKGTYNGLQYFRPDTYDQFMLPTEQNYNTGIGLFKTVAALAAAGCGKSAIAELEAEGITSQAEFDRVYTTEELRRIEVEKNYGFGKIIGHPASTGTLFCMDLNNNLTIIVTRNRRGLNYIRYHQQFMKALIPNVVPMAATKAKPEKKVRKTIQARAATTFN